MKERTEDIPVLFNHFLNLACTELNKKVPTVPPELYTLLKNYNYPGNIRELRSMVFNAVSFHTEGILSLKTFRKYMGCKNVPVPDNQDKDIPILFGYRLPTLREASEIVLNEALKRADGNQAIAASLLDITPAALSKRLKRINSH